MGKLSTHPRRATLNDEEEEPSLRPRRGAGSPATAVRAPATHPSSRSVVSAIDDSSAPPHFGTETPGISFRATHPGVELRSERGGWTFRDVAGPSPFDGTNGPLREPVFRQITPSRSRGRIGTRHGFSFVDRETFENAEAYDRVDAPGEDDRPIFPSRERCAVNFADESTFLLRIESNGGAQDPSSRVESAVRETDKRIDDRVSRIVAEGIDRWSATIPVSRIRINPRCSLDVHRGFLLGLLAVSLLRVPVSGVPTSPKDTPYPYPYPYPHPDASDQRLFDDLENVFGDAFEDAFGEKEDLARPKTALDEDELEIIRRSIVQGLGLRRIPDPSKANVSQAEYERAHREYLKKVELSHNGQEFRERKFLHVFHATEYPGNKSSRVAETHERGQNYRHSLFFPVEIPDEDVSVDHASLRLLLEGHRSERSDVDVLVYLKTSTDSRELIFRKRIELQDPRDSRWLEFDSTEAVSSWLENGQTNHGLELEFLQDSVPIRRTFSRPVLNVFTASQARERRKRSSPEELMSLHKGRRTKCKGESKKCCRHELTVMFKDLKGFEFIVYPKTFDAGYCKGRCPPRYNPAHHHALLQSLLWKEDRKKVPKPCCAPSKLDQLMIVYFDENDSTELKVSYWKNIQVLECACS